MTVSDDKISTALDKAALKYKRHFGHLKNQAFYNDFNLWFSDEIGHLQAKGKIGLGETEDGYIDEILYVVLAERGEFK